MTSYHDRLLCPAACDVTSQWFPAGDDLCLALSTDLGQVPVAWPQARHVCSTLQPRSDLGSFPSAEHDDILAFRMTPHTSYWVGLAAFDGSIVNMTWLDGSIEGQGSKFILSSELSPSQDQLCGHVTLQTYALHYELTWTLDTCELQLPYICSTHPTSHGTPHAGETTSGHVGVTAGSHGHVTVQQTSPSSQATATPSQVTATPSQVTATPSQVTATPSQVTATPSQVTATPSQVTATPSQVTATPSQVTATPSQVTATPSQATATPSQATATPSQVTDTSSHVTATPSQATATPSQVRQ
ncbi:zonadhesin-like [Physella acuta]|uniref:zonadhesin-like n=1 Tax=Physella acuta TaxID=109671 RepID=UPI0027DACE98|nr:zonadhesin-like [Physella acuta]